MSSEKTIKLSTRLTITSVSAWAVFAKSAAFFMEWAKISGHERKRFIGACRRTFENRFHAETLNERDAR
jgi:hypothetical protein